MRRPYRITYREAAHELAAAVQGLLECERLASTSGCPGDQDAKAQGKARAALRTYKKAKNEAKQ